MINQLVNALSPYLRQHAHQPVHWQMWCKEAFDLAQEQDKPIFLSIGYATCHWCHVMAHESFDDPAIAQIINNNFIPIKVDREEFPAVDHLYMTALMQMTQQGGWPLNIFLTSSGKPFFGGTYFPVHARYGQGAFRDVLLTVADYWLNQRAEITDHADKLIEGIHQMMTVSQPGVDHQQALAGAYQQMVAQQDLINGGFGGAPKFPTAHVLSFMLANALIMKDDVVREHVLMTLRKMAQGGIFDHLAGGFHRYSVDEHWHVPHFEKMLYDQAGLLGCYLQAFQVTKENYFADLARAIADFILSYMQSPLGGFYTAQDADSLTTEGQCREGAFYVFKQEEIRHCLGKDAALFNMAFGVLPEGNVFHDPHGEFGGMNVLYRAKTDEQLAKQWEMAAQELRDKLKEMCEKMRQWREQYHPTPMRDEKILMDMNALAIEALAFAGAVLGEDRYIKASRQAIDFICNNLYQQGQWLHRYYQGVAGIPALLDDKVFFIKALQMFASVSGDLSYEPIIKQLLDDVCQNHINEQGLCFSQGNMANDLPCPVRDLHDGAYGSANSALMAVLYYNWMITGNGSYEKLAQQVQDSYGQMMFSHPSSMTAMLLNRIGFMRGGYKVAINPQDKALFVKVRNLLYKEFNPWLILTVNSQVPLGEMMVCVGQGCFLSKDLSDDVIKKFEI
jgi:uncharacterized protein YyaL (SSP411 family)